MAAPAWRERMIERLGEIPWKGVYSVVSLVGLVLIVWGYGMARVEPVGIWAPPTWLRHVALLLMLPVFPLLLAAYLPGRIQTAAKHPMLAAVKLWAFAHLLANGNLADLMLFGSFLAWAVADRISLKRRGDPQFATVSVWGDVIAVVVGTAITIWFILQLHGFLFGVTPI
jgi:uncharacterized membrane protein